MSSPLLGVALLTGATAGLYGRVIGRFFTGDDTVYLQAVATHSPLSYAFVPAVWQSVGWRFYTPWFLFTFDVDHALFGLDPRLYYVHQLLALALASSLVFLLLSRWLPWGAALAGAALFLVGPTVPSVAGALWCRHYVEGLSLALLATMAFLASVERRSVPWSVAAAALYLGALTAKEIYVPLPFLLLALPEGHFRARVRAAAPLLGTLLAFALWRTYMLGGIVAGYDESSQRLSAIPGRAMLLFTSLPALLFPGYSRLEVVAVAAIALTAVLLLVRRPRLLARVAWSAFLVALPLVPVAGNIQARYLFLPWAAVSVVAALLLGRAVRLRPWGPFASALCLGLVGVLAVRGNRRAFREEQSIAVRSGAEGAFFFEKSLPGDVLRQPLEAEWLFGGLRWLRRNVAHRGEAGIVAYDDWAFCAPGPPGPSPPRVFEFSPAAGGVVESPGLADRIRSRCTERVRADAPLDVRLSYDGRFLRWTLGPYRDGAWSFLTPGTFARYDFPASGTNRIPVTGDFLLTVRYASPEGWLAYSAPLTMHVADGRGNLEWKR